MIARREFITQSPLRWLCWLPLGVLLAMELYVGRFDGWGAWASAPLLLVPAVVSIPVVAWGASRVAAERRAGEASRHSIVCTLVAGLPLFWIFVRRFVM